MQVDRCKQLILKDIVKFFLPYNYSKFNQN